MPHGSRLYEQPKKVQPSLCEYYAGEFAGYIKRRNAKVIGAGDTTLNDLCTRFRMNHREALMVINSTQRLVLSQFAYKLAPEGAPGGEIMASGHPTLWPDAPKGQRIVMVFEDKWEEELERIADSG